MSDEKVKIHKIIDPSIRIVKNFAPPLAAALQQLALINPAFALLIGTMSGILGYYSDYAGSKAINLIEELIKHQDRFLSEIVESDKFKAVFFKMLGDYINEGNEQRRLYIKNYIINMASGKFHEFDEHTRLVTVLNSISLREVELLSYWKDDGVVEQYYSTNPQARNITIDVSELDNILRNSGLQPISSGYQGKSETNQLLLQLGYKNLLYTLGADNFGSGVEAKTKGITDFGKTFLGFILSD
ncbi:MAG: hypothetical protein ACPGO5_03325 [Patescibacteria group bacterium]